MAGVIEMPWIRYDKRFRHVQTILTHNRAIWLAATGAIDKRLPGLPG